MREIFRKFNKFMQEIDFNIKYTFETASSIFLELHQKKEMVYIAENVNKVTGQICTCLTLHLG